MKIAGLLVVSFALIFNAFASDIYEDVSRAVRSADAKQLASYFGSSVDLTLVNQEDVYSKAQAELLIKDFFDKNSPKSFEIVHKGSSREGTLFAVGSLVSSNGKTFRVSFTVKMIQGKHMIQEIRFDLQ
jgi:hypothetical protein